MRIEIHPTHPQARRVHQAVDVLRRGGVIVYPTGTVYGLGCDIHQKKAVERIYQVKKRSRDLPLILLLHDTSQVSEYIAEVPEKAVRAMQEFFRPEFINRLDHIVPFSRLDREELAEIEINPMFVYRDRICAVDALIHVTEAG